MKNADVGHYLLHIVDACNNILRFTQGMEQSDFLKNDLVQYAVISNFEIIGEASKHVSDDFRNQYPEIKWRAMAGLRDILIHHYFGVDFVNLWNIIKTSLPTVLEQIKNSPEYIAARNQILNNN